MTESTQFLSDSLRIYYGIDLTTSSLLPLGADVNASVYKVDARDGKSYFVKLKRGHFHVATLAILRLLQDAGFRQLISPVKTLQGEEIHRTEGVTLIVYPFVDGVDGFSRSLKDDQWIVLGRALRTLHDIKVPLALQQNIRREDFSSTWREAVRSLYARIDTIAIADEIAMDFRKILDERKRVIHELVEGAEQLSQRARTLPLKFVLCHADIHGGNVLLDDKEGFYIVDWDDPMLAPKERDLMFIGGGVGNVWNRPYEVELFYRGYGETMVDSILLAYYRYERIVVDIVEYAQELLLKPLANNNRREMFQQFLSMFAQNGVVDIAIDTARRVDA